MCFPQSFATAIHARRLPMQIEVIFRRVAVKSRKTIRNYENVYWQNETNKTNKIIEW